MECDTYVSGFLKYLKDFVANIRPDDPLPVRAPSYKVTESEIDGQILDIVHHYLNSRECPPYVREYVGHRVWTSIRNPHVNGDGMEDDIDGPNNATNHTFDSMKLIQEVTGKANDVIREMANSLSPEEVEKLPRYHPISHFAIKNTRRKMEDRHVIIHDLNTLYGMKYDPPHAYYGVFDGHAGTDAAVYSAAHLHQYMIQNPQYETTPEAALKHAFHITDTNFIKKAAKERLKGGTTAVVALVREKRLVVAWLGDSQALLVRQRNPVRMVEPHKPDLPVERERVESMGGCVINIQGTWRVLGQLAVSRAIGDADYKPYVSSECDIKSLEIEGDEDFLVLACDGLWDTLSAQDAVNVVYAYLTRNNGDTDGVGRCLVEAARSTGSEDNITAVVVFLRPVATLMEEEAQRLAQGQVPDDVPAVVMEKDSTPSSINAIFSPPIFSPPINQFELSENASPKLFNADEFEKHFDMNNHHNGVSTEEASTPASSDGISPCKDQDEPMEGCEAPVIPPQDYDSDEGVAVTAEDDNMPSTQQFNPHDAPTPTAEEVDAALAELDSIPDGVCESGEVEEEEEEEEEWSYFCMEPQNNPQGEDVLGGTAISAVVVPPPAEDFEVLPDHKDQLQNSVPDIIADPIDEPIRDFDHSFANIQKNDILDTFEQEQRDINQPMEANTAPLIVDKIPDILDGNMEPIPSLDDHPERLINFSGPGIEKVDNLMGISVEPNSPNGSGSPHAPGSPRSVEGFVTSVELNTPDESFATNFAVNQAQDFAGIGDQASGPFSVYVSSSPEPASLDPPMQSGVDFNMSAPLTNGQVEENHTLLNQTEDKQEVVSPVEIVHAQSTVEVVAPPSPVEISGPETQFIMPDQITNLSQEEKPVDISFVPQPVIEPSAEIPVPVYVDDTPISESDALSEQIPSPVDKMVDMAEADMKMQVEEMNFSNFESSTSEIQSKAESLVETIQSTTESMVENVQSTTASSFENVQSMTESFIETSQTEMSETISQVESSAEAIISESVVEAESHRESAVESSKFESTVEAFSNEQSTVETVTSELVSHMESESNVLPQMESVNRQLELSQSPLSPVTAMSPVEAAPPQIIPELEQPTTNLLSPVEPEVCSAPVLDIPEIVSLPAKIEETVEIKAPAKTKTPAKTTTDKAPSKTTLGKSPATKATPGKATPGKATPTTSRTPSRTPSTKTPSSKTPTLKPTEKKPITKSPAPAASKTATTRPSTTRPTTTKPATTKPSAAKPTTTKAPTRSAPTKTAPPTSRLSMGASKPTTKSTGIAGAPKPATTSRTTTTRPTPAARTTTPATTRKPLASSKPTDKTDSKLTNGTSRPSSRPTTARTSTTSGTATRKPLSSSTAKPGAEKETKNTANKILSTRPTKPPNTTRTSTTTKTTTAHSITKTKSTDSASAAKTRVTSTTRTTTASKTTGAATKKTLVSKTKAAPGSTKTTTVKAKTENAVIEATEPLVNGENKIADEETSVEVIEKSVVEDIMQQSMTEKQLTEALSEPVVVSSELTTELLVNGDH